MKCKKNIIIGLIIVTSLFLKWCSIGNNEFETLVKSVNEYNENIKVPDIDLTSYTNDLKEDEMLTWDEFSNFFQYSPKEFKTNNQYKRALIEDIELLFKALRTNYAPYNYFGGDEAFIKVKDEVLEYINLQQEVEKNEIVKLLIDKLSFIDDKHFFVENYNTVNNVFMYVDEHNNYYKDDDGYYKVVNKEKEYIKSIDGNWNIKENIKYAINDNGELVYRTYVMRENTLTLGNNPISNKIKVDIVYESNSVLEVDFDVVGTKEYSNVPIFEQEEKNNISIVTMKAMKAETDEKSVEFIESAVRSRNSKITILDLRDNCGGDGVLPTLWLQSRFNKIVKSNSKGLFIQREAERPQEIGNIEDASIYKYNSFEAINEYYYKMQDKGTEGLIKNDKYIFVLIDKYTGSAGEYFIDLLRRIENVIIVGSNSSGVINSSIYGNLFLPNTGLNFAYGNHLRVYDKELFEEGRGFMPDIIVDDDETLDKVLQLIEYYKLN